MEAFDVATGVAVGVPVSKAVGVFAIGNFFVSMGCGDATFKGVMILP